MANTKKRPKYIFVVGGVMSSVGKGTVASSIAYMLQSRKFRATAMKIDPYVNVDAGTMNPTEHGEVFVTDDGDETDQDMGNYERFLNTSLSSTNYMTTGRVYLSVIERERNLGYAGKCVEVVPHIPLEVINRIRRAQRKTKSHVTIIEIGGTIGEYQNILFLEAARMMKLANPDDVAVVMVSYLPIPSVIGEMKTKPTQTAVRSLNSAGLNADFIICRSSKLLDAPRRAKLAMMCNLRDADDAISAPDLDSVYEVPLWLEEQGLGKRILERLKLPRRQPEMRQWKTFVGRSKKAKKEVKIAVVGKYFSTGKFTLADSYISVIEALKLASWYNDRKPVLTWVDSEEYERHPKKVSELAQFDGILVPGGFGTRGIEGIMKAIRFAREKKIPYFGLCYGMQLACVEMARDLLDLRGAHTVEANPQSPHPIIHLNPIQKRNIRQNRYGGTMRLGAYDCAIQKGTKTWQAYKSVTISERHRHRYEFNNEYMKPLAEKAGMIFSGMNKDHNLVEIIELKDHPWFVGVQFHPEFQSAPLKPHPLFLGFVAAAVRYSK